jgi:hypothetical protein
VQDVHFPSVTFCNPRGQDTGKYVRSIFNNFAFLENETKAEIQNGTMKVNETGAEIQNTTMIMNNTMANIQNMTIFFNNTEAETQNMTMFMNNTEADIQNTTLFLNNTEAEIQNMTMQMNDTQEESPQNSTKLKSARLKEIFVPFLAVFSRISMSHKLFVWAMLVKLLNVEIPCNYNFTC